MKTYFFSANCNCYSHRKLWQKENKQRAKANEYLADFIRHANEEGFEIFIREGINVHLMTAFQFTPDTQIFSTIIACTHKLQIEIHRLIHFAMLIS